jgi:hypothetical protein
MKLAFMGNAEAGNEAVRLHCDVRPHWPIAHVNFGIA